METMKKWTILFSLSLAMLLGGCSEPEKKAQAPFQIDRMNEKSDKLSELLTDVEYIPLETSDTCLLHEWAKILSVKGNIYVSSMNEIYKFDGKGAFIGKLSHIGQGPADYVKINDFEVVGRKGSMEIWIAHEKGISRYEDGQDFSFLGIISTSCSINAFTYLSDETIIVKTPEEYTFHLCDMKGTFRHGFLERDPANLSVSLLPFIEVDERKIYPIDQTDEAVVYNEQTDSLELFTYASGNIDKLLTRKDNQEYMERYGYLQQPGKIAETFTRIVTMRRQGDTSIVFLRSPKDEKMLIRHGNGNEWDAYTLHPQPSLENDLLPGLNVRFFISAFSCDSDDSFLFYTPATNLAGEEINGKIISEEDNPVLVKYHIQ